MSAQTKTASPDAAAPASRRALGIGRYGRLVLPIVGTLIAFAGQLAEDASDSPPLQMGPPTILLQRWLLVGLVAYLFGIWAVAERTVERSLTAARPAVEIDDEAFARYARRMETLPLGSESAILVTSALVSVLLFAVLRADLVVNDPVTGGASSLPSTPLGVVVLAGYAVLGWAFLRLLYGIARLARALGALTREPLRVNVFDTSDLLPFGNIALALALAPAGAIVILVITLGAPTAPVGWSVLIEATIAMVLAVLLPLSGVHRQMASAKHVAFTALSERVTEVYDTVTGEPIAGEHEDWGRLGGQTGTILQLRKAVQEMTTWPFRDTLALSRALLIAAAPLIYTTLSEFIRIVWLAPLSNP